MVGKVGIPNIYQTIFRILDLNQVIPNTPIGLQLVRKQAGLRQQDLADKLGMPQSTYAYKEATGTFDESERKRIAKILIISYARHESGIT